MPKCAGDVRGREREGLFDRHVEVADEADGFLEVAFHAAHAEAHHFTLVVEAGHGAVAVGGERDVRRIDAGGDRLDDGLGRMVEAAGGARRDVDPSRP